MNIISFIGNCQTLTLCFYFQQLLNKSDFNSNWLLYGNEFRRHLGPWSNKCVDKILDERTIIEKAKKSDIIIYQEVKDSTIAKTDILKALVKPSCKLIKIPSIHLDYKNFDASLNELKLRENAGGVNITVSNLLEKYRNQNQMLTVNHPNTKLFIEIVQELCTFLNLTISFPEKISLFLKNNNYMNLP